MDLSLPLTWNEGVFLLPAAELPEDVRRRITPEEGDLALTRPQGRSGSKLVDREAADLLERFREPRTLAEAVLLYSRARGLEPEGVLEESFPLIRSLLASGYLVPLGEGAAKPAAENALDSLWQAGDDLPAGRVERVLQVLEDTELYLLRTGDGVRVLKAARARGGSAPPALRATFEREARVLDRLGGVAAPALLDAGQVEGLPFLLMEHVAGVHLEEELAGIDPSPAGRGRRLRLARAVAAAYAGLHRRGVVHGDVHPRNLLVARDGSVRLVDFGLARLLEGGGEVGAGEAAGEPSGAPPRGGIPFFYEPELARAFRDGAPPPPATPAGEQYAVGVMLYRIFTGSYPRDYSLGRDEMLSQVADLPPLPFAERGTGPWPEVEAVLTRTLARRPEERHASVADLEAALAEVAEPGPPEEGSAGRLGTSRSAPAAGPSRAPSSGPVEDLLRRCRAASAPGGVWFEAERLPAPSASINYGAAGLALGLLHLARARDDAGALALADLWLHRARRDGDDDGFYRSEIEITRELVGESTPFHSPSGTHAVAALLARARGDRVRQAGATAAFVEACGLPARGLDLTLGRSSHLLGATLLLDAWPEGAAPVPPALLELGDGALAQLWEHLDGEPEIERSAITYPGVAHGWAGFLYATLAWCALRGSEVPAGVERRCDELALLSRPEGRGLVWPWTLDGQGRHATMAGWCNGSCGHLFLWILAHRWSGDPRHLELATGAAWDTWDGADTVSTLCCGAAGRGYALLAFHRHTGDPAWLERTRLLVQRSARHLARPDGGETADLAHALYKGELGLAVLAADLERSEQARMPFFEPVGWRVPAF